MESRMAGIDDLKAQTVPVVVWGTKSAAKMCCRLLKKIDVTIAAIGDNNYAEGGQALYDIPILGLQEIRGLYPDALVVVGSFFDDVTDFIIRELWSVNNGFTFIRFAQIEYLYELECLERQVINNEIWQGKPDRCVMTEYRYILHDNAAADLKRHLSGIYGVKYLVLIAGGEFYGILEQLVNELAHSVNIGHIIIVIDHKKPVCMETLTRLSTKVFYVICDESVSSVYLNCLWETKNIIETRELPPRLFCHMEESTQAVVTEDVIFRSVLNYIAGGETHDMKEHAKLSNRPVYIVQLFNGLANQALMYLFGKFIEGKTERTVIFDDTILSLDVMDKQENMRRIGRWAKALASDDVEDGVEETRKRNSFYQFKRAEIAEVFDIPICLLSDYFEEEVWELYLDKIKKEHLSHYAQGFPLCHVLLENGLEIEIVRDSLLPKEFLSLNHCYCIDAFMWGKHYGKNSIMDFLLHNNENLYFMGGWANGIADDWFIHNRSWVRHKLPFRMPLDKKNRRYEDEITHSDGIMVHVRRGDFSYFKAYIDTDYYKNAIQLAESMEKYVNKKYFIFSDDIEWCQDHGDELGFGAIRDKITFISGNNGKDSYIDMYLISLGKVIIPTPGSTFSYVSMLASSTVELSINMSKYYDNLKRGLPLIVEMMEIR